MTAVYVDQDGALVRLCEYCTYYRATHGPYCELCHAHLNAAPAPPSRSSSAAGAANPPRTAAPAIDLT